MTERPACLKLVDNYVAGAMIAHEYAFGLHRKLMETGADNDYTRTLLGESTAVALEMPVVAHRLDCLEREWSEQEPLDPPAARRTLKRLENAVADLTTELVALSDRHKQVVADLLALVRRAS